MGYKRRQQYQKLPNIIIHGILLGLSLVLYASACSTATTFSPTECINGGIENASLDKTNVSAGAAVRISGRMSVKQSATINVRLDRQDIGSLAADESGSFAGRITIPEGLSGSYSLALTAGPCSGQRLILCIGDSVTEGAFVSSIDHHYATILHNELVRRLPGEDWKLQVYGVSGYGSLILDDSFNSSFYQDLIKDPLYFPREWWKDAKPDLVVIELGMNNLIGLDASTRYDGNLRGYANNDEAIAWWKKDLDGAVAFLSSQKGIPANHILVLGQWPNGSSTSTSRGERFAGGHDEIIWNRWNAEMEQECKTIGCTFVRMADIFGPGYIPDHSRPDGDPHNYLDHSHGDSEVHPNDLGSQLFASRIISSLPPDLMHERQYLLTLQISDS